MKTKLIVVIALLFTVYTAEASTVLAGGDMWLRIDDSALRQRPMERARVPERYSTFSLNKRRMRDALERAPEEFGAMAGSIIQLPMPDGSLARFRVEHSLIVEPGLVAKYPDLGATYAGTGIDDPTASVRLDFLPSGFHAMILSASGSVIIDPYAKTDTDNYVSFFKGDLQRVEDFNCETESGKTPLDEMLDDTLEKYRESGRQQMAPEVTSGTTLRTYRLALAGNFEYCAAASVGGNTVSNCLAAMVLIMNRVNGVYERDVTLRMVMVANNNLIAYAADNMTCPVPGGSTACTSGNDPYTNGTGDLNSNTGTLNTVIGSGNYDIGHIFTTGSGGVAFLGVPCGASKGGGTTGLPNPTGDPFAIDFVAHEMGHQWGGSHTFNGATGNCSGGNRSAANSYEPGSGITVMAYAGICGSQDLAGNSIDTFHVRSLEQIVAYSQTGNGNTCDAETATGNTPPTVTLPLGNSFNIPRNTPFALTASATDVNGDTLTYDWQEYDTGGGTGTTAIPNTDSDGTARPIFRPYLPVANGTRFFPSLPFILNSANVPPSTTGGFLTGELLPAITRTMNFQVIVRDNRANGGGINTATATVNVNAGSGPFLVTAPNTSVTWAGNSSQTVTWDVAGTTAAPVSAANVNILLSTDGGNTFPTVISANTPNDGSQSITVPNVNTTTARIKVEGAGNIFFDISNVNFTINAVAATRRAPFDYDGDDKTDISIFRPTVGEWWYQRSSTGLVSTGVFGNSTDKIVPGDYTGDQKTDIAFWRPSTGEWFVLRSEDSLYFAVPFGSSGDIPVPGDYDNDGKTDPAVYRPTTNTWFVLKSGGGGVDFYTFGTSGDKPVVADYDGDNKTDIAIFRPTSGQWWIRRSSDGGISVATFGVSTDRPVQGYYTPDNKVDIAFWRPTTGEWFILRSEDSLFLAVPFGSNGDIPVPGDYDGDDRFDLAVFRANTTTWFAQRTTAGLLFQNFGLATDLPTPSAYVPAP